MSVLNTNCLHYWEGTRGFCTTFISCSCLLVYVFTYAQIKLRNYCSLPPWTHDDSRNGVGHILSHICWSRYPSSIYYVACPLSQTQAGIVLLSLSHVATPGIFEPRHCWCRFKRKEMRGLLLGLEFWKCYSWYSAKERCQFYWKEKFALVDVL